MRKVLVDPDVLEEAAKWLEVHSSGPFSAEAFAADALREVIAQPAEVEGVVPVVCYLRAFQDGTPNWTEDCVCEDAVYPNHDEDETYSMPMVRQADHIAALSAVTAERDQLRAEVEALRKDAERYRWIRQQGLPDAAIIEMDSYYDTVTFAKECRLDTAIDNAMQKS